MRVHDATGDGVFVIFDRDGKELLNKSAADLFEAEDKVCLFHFVYGFVFVYLYMYICIFVFVYLKTFDLNIIVHINVLF